MNALAITHYAVRYIGVLLILLGITLWTGNALNLIPLHMALGVLFVLSLWTLAALAARAGVALGFVVLVAVWGIVVIALGMTQDSLLPNNAHWVIQVLHLLVGMAAIGQGEGLYRRAARSSAAATA